MNRGLFLRLFQRKATNGKGAAKVRGFVGREMTPEQVAEAHRLAREWLTQHCK